MQCLHPVGHWDEFANLFRNNVLRDLLTEWPRLRYLPAHNIDTTGVTVDPAPLGRHIEQQAGLTCEVIDRQIDDTGGGLARVAFGLTRDDLIDNSSDAAHRVTDAVRRMAARMPVYITLKDVKKRWGQAQEDVYPVTQFEKLRGDMTAVPDLERRCVTVPGHRGKQLKEVAELDTWLRDGSAAYVNSLCEWS